MRSRPLYLEQRVAVARHALNKHSAALVRLLRPFDRPPLTALVLDVIAVLDGDRDAAKRLARRKS